jgi:hypothetical protein
VVSTTGLVPSVTPFQLVDDAAPHPHGALLPPLGGLFAAGAVAWLACPVPPVHSLPWADVFLIAVNYVLLVCLTSLAVVWCILTILRSRAAANVTIFRSIAAVACWFAPTVIFLVERSLWAVVVSALLAGSVTLLVRMYCNGGDADEIPTSEFQLVRRLPSSLCASACIQAGAVGVALEYPAPAASMIAISSAILTWTYTAAGMRARGSPWLRSLAVLIITVLFSAGGLMRYLRVERGSGSGNGGAYAQQAGENGEPAPPNRPGDVPAPVTLGETYVGVILWPDVQPKTMLVAPLPAMGRGLSQMSRVRPLTIPFYGAYWFFKSPDRRPPRNSLMSRGSPALMKFNTTDRTPLAMEAHQNFGALIDLSCCSQIQLAIRNGDLFPSTISLELILVNTTLAGRPSMSLGTAGITSMSNWNPAVGRSPAEEVLTFPVPSPPSLREFDEATIVYRLRSPRRDTSAKVSIERFHLVPHGVALQ